MSVMLQGDDLLLVLGRQDSGTWLARLSLAELLGSLAAVTPEGRCG